ncbi:MAG: fatty acid desaturase [Lentisphaeraceae bacterium]|nr:fatty acid desaturase [Lentisphaeraceae bacterium]
MNYLKRYPELINVVWQDLAKTNNFRMIAEILLPLPFLSISLVFFYFNKIPEAYFTAFFFFLTGLRLSHNAQHNIVGCSKKTCDIILFCLSLLMMNSMHAVQVTHLRHHANCLGDNDEEGFCAKMKFYEALLYGPLFTINMHRNALKYGSQKQRLYIKVELLAEVLVFIYCVLAAPLFLQIFIYSMLFANCLTAFFCVWLVHYALEEHNGLGRTVRNPILNILSFNMFLHVEHHLFPQVPTYNLVRLAKRIDLQTNKFKENSVFGFKLRKE